MAKSCFRHFKALARKNFINWKRTPVCSILEIIFPTILMSTIVIMRHYIDLTTTVDQAGMLEKKVPFFPGSAYEGGTWSTDTSKNSYLDSLMHPLVDYDNYSEAHHNHTPSLYDVGQDWKGPQYFYPTQCAKQFSFKLVRQPSPVIAVVGEQNEITDRTSDYFPKLRKLQVASNPELRLILPKYVVKHFDNETEFYDYLEAPEYNDNSTFPGVCLGMQVNVSYDTNTYSVKQYFNDQNFLGSKFAYAIPPQSNDPWVPFQSSPDIENYLRYAKNGYSYLQNVIAISILAQKTGNVDAWIIYMVQPMQTEVSIYDAFQNALAALLPLFLLFAYIPPVYNMVFRLVKEKESGAKESMRMMGMTDAPYWLSWFVHYTAINTVVSLCAWGVLLINTIQYSSKGYLLLFFWLYGEAVFGQIVFLQSFFSQSKFAGIVATIVYFGGGLVNKFLSSADLSRTKKILASIIPQAALQQGSIVFAEYECTGVGIDSSTAAVIYQNYSFNTALAMMAASFALFFTLGLYLDKIIPSKYGSTKNPCFCFMPSTYACCRRDRRRRQVDDGDAEGQLLAAADNDFEAATLGPNNYEAPPLLTKRLEAQGDYLKVQGLTKEFGNFIAVNNLNVKMFDGQIFALLGHNGAGKTTTISMLTGLIGRTSGSAVVYERDIFEEPDEVREFMGVCPQHDVLFELLTPREHLDIFYDFKGGDPARKQAEIDALIEDVGLTIDQNKISCTLSGGNKRKTSVSIALCGGSKLVILDEPTSGMDLGARRGLWDMLKKYKRDRIILLTTHYMDEADVLGDRIGIMARGKLMCIGSSLFLKNRFGLGYKLTFVKKHKKAHPQLTNLVISYFQGVQKQSEVAGEVTYLIPRNQTQNFKVFFEVLDQRLADYEIKSYGVSMTTLEEVFLNINEELAPDLGSVVENKQLGNVNLSGDLMASHPGGQLDKINHTNSDSGRTLDAKEASMSQENSSFDANKDSVDGEEGEYLVRGSSCLTTVEASTIKRWNMYRRDYCGFVCQVISPLILIVFGLMLTSQPSKLQQSPPRFLSTALYPQQRILMGDTTLHPNPANETGEVITPQQIYANLPNVTDPSQPFEVKYITPTDFLDFYNQVYEFRNEEPLFPYRYGSYQIFEANKTGQQYRINNFINVTSQDVTAIYPQYMYTALLRSALDDPNLTFNVTTAAFPVFYAFRQREGAARALDYTFMLSIALSLVPCVIVSFVLNEREKQLKHQQLISGMSMCGYWAANVICDIASAYVPMLAIILLNFAFSLDATYGWLFLLVYPFAVVPFSYITSFAFSDDTTAQISTLFIHFLASGAFTVVVYVLQLIALTARVGDVLRFVGLIVPSYAVTHAFIFAKDPALLYNVRNEAIANTDPDLPPWPQEPWSWYNLKADLVALIGHFVIGLLILGIIESPLFDSCKDCACCDKPMAREITDIDDDVRDEEDRLMRMVRMQKGLAPGGEGDEGDEEQQPAAQLKQSTDSKNRESNVIQVNNFSKIYRRSCACEQVRAVQGVSFGVDYGECFALLGVNGAGKSTTFKSLTRDIVPTTGDISIQGFDVQQDFTSARKLIGYCPQYDAIFPLLTVEEHLWFYARLKGIHKKRRAMAVEKAIADLNLQDHRKKASGTLSGGNKRKLSVAMATIGNPPIILLDEPSAGMDPQARRFMWMVVEKISQRDKKSAVILTSHSMEEAEALSTKLGIMVRGGVFRCFGTSQHVKNKFGYGYELEVKVKKAELHELRELSENLGLGKDLQRKVNLKDALITCERAGYNVLILEQVRADGIGADLVLEAGLDPAGEVRALNLVTFLYAQRIGFRVIDYLLTMFSQVEMLEQCGDFYKLRVPKESRTIGWLFGRIEDHREEIGIQEYSVSQTSLEQIFQMFANQSIAEDKNAYVFKKSGDAIILLNPNREVQPEQDEVQSRGLSVASRTNSQAHMGAKAEEALLSGSQKKE